MELRDLRYFVVVAEHQNLGRAAEVLNLSTTALGKSLRRLEKGVGAKLVQRASKGVTLTAVGAALLRRVGPLQGMLNDVRHEAADLAQGRTGHVIVGSNVGLPELRLASAYAELSMDSPMIALKVMVAETDVLRGALHKGEIDFCIASPRSFPPTEFVHENLYDESYVVFASAHHRLAKRKQVALAELTAERWATLSNTSLPPWQTLLRAFENKRLPVPVVTLECNSFSFRTAAIAQSNHIGLTTTQHLRLEAGRFPIVELPVKEFSYFRTISIIYRKDAYLSPAAKRLIEILKTQAREMSSGIKRSPRRRS